MCGIAYLHDFTGNSVNNSLLDVFDNQRSRGVQGFGLYDGRGHIVRATKEEKILKWLCEKESNLILFHHRYPTSTDNTKSTAHPFTTKDYFGDTQYILVHNGHINNCYGVRQEHEKQGIEYSSVQPDNKFNDSEALLWDFALTMEGKQEGLEAYGQIAFICLKLVKGELEKMYFGRNSNPLNLYRTKDGIALSSEGPGEAIDPQTLYTWNYKLKRLTHKALKIPAYYSDSAAYETPSYETPRDWRQRPSQYDYEEYEEELEWANTTKVADEEVVNLLQGYLQVAKGNIDKAYDLLEIDYQQIAEDARTVEEYGAMRVFEAAMLLLEEDMEWTTEDSISSLYEPQLQLTEGS